MMKKSLVWIFCFVPTVISSQVLMTPTQELISEKSVVQQHKFVIDTLWYEDFDGALPACWSIVNNDTNNMIWQWDTLYRRGAFSGFTQRINSSSASNGFMLLPLDSFNTPLTSGNPALMPMADTYFQSCGIPISPKPSVWLGLQQYSRFCCNPLNYRVVVQVSSDNFQTYDEYNLHNDTINGTSPNAEHVLLDVSATLANDSIAYLRFYIEGLSHYYWMIDDVVLMEGPGLVGLDESKEASFFNIYPNPSRGLVQVNSLDKIRRVQLFDVRGKLVNEKTEETQSINLEENPKGLYLLKVQFENGQIKSEKLLLE